jgi:hypothetical protein
MNKINTIKNREHALAYLRPPGKRQSRRRIRKARCSRVLTPSSTSATPRVFLVRAFSPGTPVASHGAEPVFKQADDGCVPVRRSLQQHRTHAQRPLRARAPQVFRAGATTFSTRFASCPASSSARRLAARPIRNAGSRGILRHILSRPNFTCIQATCLTLSATTRQPIATPPRVRKSHQNLQPYDRLSPLPV